MARLFFIISNVLLTCSLLNAEVLSVRLFTNLQVSSSVIAPATGEYYVYADGVLVSKGIDIYQLNIEGEKVLLKTLDRFIGKFTSVFFSSYSSGAILKIKANSYKVINGTYSNDVEVSVSAGTLKFINKIDVESYVSGVVEAESGTNQNSEYYKLQAILCRTYALSHLRRHELEGYHLCDQVHCQVYKGGSKSVVIKNATIATSGLVIVDGDLNLITAAFHSNCGGQTMNSEDVWTLPTSYLRSVRDTFCVEKPHAKWERRIPVDDWKSYLALKYKYELDETDTLSELVTYSQGAGREVYFSDRELKIPLKTIRADWQLKSTYFSVSTINDQVVFQGKGFGHGVGMCQEGAMRMSELGYKYEDILHYYYKNVHLVDLSSLEFFRAE